MTGELVLVTGGSGFVATHCIIQLLEGGYRVRATLRASETEESVHAALTIGGVDEHRDIEFIEADLFDDEPWPTAVQGCSYVLHIASPLPSTEPDDEDELIIPAREGTLRVLRAARDAGVKRVVMTSSFSAIGSGHQDQEADFTEEDWTEISDDLGGYAKSKTLAERAAWSFMSAEGGDMELSVINPVAIFGPVHSADFSTSIRLLRLMITGDLPGLPRLTLGIVDVRDVASLHLIAMTHDKAAGERFIAASERSMTMKEIAESLRESLGSDGRKIPHYELPNWLTRAAARVIPAISSNLAELDKDKSASNAKAREVLGWRPRPAAEALLASAESLIRLHLA